MLIATTAQAVVGGAVNPQGRGYCQALWSERGTMHYPVRSYAKPDVEWEYENDPLGPGEQMVHDGSTKSGFAPACTDKQVVCSTYPNDPTLRKEQCGIKQRSAGSGES